MRTSCSPVLLQSWLQSYRLAFVWRGFRRVGHEPIILAITLMTVSVSRSVLLTSIPLHSAGAGRWKLRGPQKRH